MAMQYKDTLLNAIIEQLEATIGASPTLEIRTGAKPANVTDADSGTLLVSIPLGADWLSAGTNGQVTINGSPSANAVATGTAGHFRIKSSGSTVFVQGTATIAGGGGDLTLVNDSIAVNQPVTVNTATFTLTPV